MADRGGNQGAGSGRHHRRVAHPQPQGAHAGGRAVRRNGARPGAGHRRRRVELHPRGHRADPPCQAGRRRCGPLGRALLQQAHPGRPLPALRRHRRGGRSTDRALQYPRPLHRGDRRRDDGEARPDPEHRRRQGRDRKPRPREPRPRRARPRVSSVSRATTRPPWASTRMAGWAASRSRRTSPRMPRRSSRTPAPPGTMPRRLRSRTV